MIINTDLIYPIGSIYISVNAINPSRYFGGTWEQLTGDAYLKIVTEDAGTYAGTSSDHKIPISSMPSHTHGYMTSACATPMSGWNMGYGVGRYGSNYDANKNVNNTGGGQAYYPYYYGVYCWKRTA